MRTLYYLEATAKHWRNEFFRYHLGVVDGWMDGGREGSVMWKKTGDPIVRLTGFLVRLAF